MKRKQLLLLVLAGLAAGVWWLGRPGKPGDAAPEPGPAGGASADEGGGATAAAAAAGPARPGPMLRPPDPTRRFKDFTPEQRVEFARKGHGPGG